MTIDTVLNPIKIVLDTNVLISAFVFGGNPREILFYVISKKFIAVTSEVLIAELKDVETKKFKLSPSEIKLIEVQIRDSFEVVIPKKTIDICRDDSDNRVLEAAIQGGCEFIVTGDKDLLVLKKYKEIKIMIPKEFIEML